MSFALERDEVKNSFSLKRTEPRWLQNALGAVFTQGASPWPPQGNFGAVAHLSTCPLRATASSDILADVSQCNSSFALLPLRQNRFCYQSQRTAAMGRSRRRSRARRHLGAAFPAPVCCSHPPSAAPAHASHSRAMGILFPSVGVTPPWLVPGAGFGHPQHCFEPATSEGNQT